jgi:hypothetical protein
VTPGADQTWEVLTCAGESFASRVAASLLSAVGLPQLVTSSLGEYEELAVCLAADPGRLGQLRTTLARNRSTSSLFDTAGYVKNLETAYETIYDRYLAGAPPSHINEHLSAVTIGSANPAASNRRGRLLE